MDKEIDFLKPRLVGKRFENHSIPLEVLRDLSVLEEMISETAKWLYLNEHGERLRIPKGFMDGISIKMTEISEGSAIPKLVLVIAAAGASLLPSPSQEYFEKARDNVVNAIDAAENNEKITDHLPEKLLVYFDRIGRGLLDDEQIEFRPDNKTRPARLNKKTRKTLILSSSKVMDYTDEVVISGLVHEADQKRNTFNINTFDGQEITAPIDLVNKEVILEAFGSFEKKQKVTLKGIGRFNREGKLIKIESVEHIVLIDILDIAARLDEFKNLSDGWLDGKGKAFDQDGLKWLENSFDAYYDTSLPLPRLFPTTEGNVQAEWSIKDTEISIEIKLASKDCEFQAVNTVTGEEINRTFDLAQRESWDEICILLKGSGGVTA